LELFGWDSMPAARMGLGGHTMHLCGGGGCRPRGGDESNPRFLGWLLWDDMTAGENRV
jgi:hypothetical protein